MNETIFSQIPIPEFIELVREVIKEELNSSIIKSNIQDSDELLTLKEACIYLKISKVTIHKWKREGKIEFLRFGNRIRFQKSELIKAAHAKNKYL